MVKIKNQKYQWIGLTAAVISVSSFYSLVYHNFSVNDTNSLSWYWLFSGIFLQGLWGLYGYSNYILPTMILTPLITIGFLALLYLKVKLDTDFI